MKSKRLFEVRDSDGHQRAAGPVRTDKTCPTASHVTASFEGAVVTGCQPEGAGEWVRVTVRTARDFSWPDGHDATGKSVHTVRLLTELYGELGLRVGACLSEDAVETLIVSGQVSRAIESGEASLAYGDRSARRMTQKLMAKGFSREVADRAVAYLKSRGYLREHAAATRRAEQDVKKMWGPARIRSDLYAAGFEREAIDEAMETLLDGDVDFVSNCLAVIRKKYGGIPADPKGRQSMKAALVRLGYSSSEIREAEERCLHDEDE